MTWLETQQTVPSIESAVESAVKTNFDEQTFSEYIIIIIVMNIAAGRLIWNYL